MPRNARRHYLSFLMASIVRSNEFSLRSIRGDIWLFPRLFLILAIHLSLIGSDERVVDSSLENNGFNNSNSCQGSSCLLQPFAELCRRDPLLSACWMLNIVSGCIIIYTNICGADSETQQILINNCRVIYHCEFPFENKSVCLYLYSRVSTEPNELLYLASMTVEKTRWVLLHSHVSIFTPGQYAGTISFSVDLYGTFDIESDSDTAVFLIGKGYVLHRVELLFMPAPVNRRFTPVCEEGHRVIHVSATQHDVLVICDNKAYWINIGKWSKRFEITFSEPSIWTFTGATTNLYVAETSNSSVGLIAQSTANSILYCFTVSPPSQYPLQCGVILNNMTLTRGMLINGGNVSDTQFLVLLDGYVIGVVTMSSNYSYETVTTDFCHPQDNCLFVQGDVVYIGSGRRTMILDKDTFEVITTYDVGLCEVLSINSLTNPHKEVLSPSTNALASTVVSNSFAIIHTTTTAVSSTATSTGTTSLYPIVTHAATSNVNLNTSTSDVDLISVDPSTTTSADSTTVNLTNTSVAQTMSEPYNTELPSISPTTILTNTTDSSDIDAKLEFNIVAWGILAVILTLIFGLILCVVIMLVAKKFSNMRLSKLRMDQQEKMLHQITQNGRSCKKPVIQSESGDGDKQGGEVVMIPTDTKMYEQTSSTTTTIVMEKTTTTRNINPVSQVFVSTQHS